MSIEMRYEDCGFVYVGKTRLLFVPTRLVTRTGTTKADGEPLALCSASGWPEPSTADIGKALDQLSKRFPKRAIFADTREGLVPMKEAA